MQTQQLTRGLKQSVTDNQLHRNQLHSRRRPALSRLTSLGSTVRHNVHVTSSINSRRHGRYRSVDATSQGVPQADRARRALPGLRAGTHRRQPERRLARLVADARRRRRIVARRQGVAAVSQRLLADV